MRFQLPGETFYIGKAVGCLGVFSKDYTDNLLQQIAAIGGPMATIMDRNVAIVGRHIFADMVATKSDKQFRTPLTPELKRYAGIENELVIVGCGEYAELWSPARWETYLKENESDENVLASGTALLAFLSGKPKGQANAGVSQTGPA